ncbi:hybrid sensor histidine kinase/response regulator [soil metagenome]
MTDSDDFAQRLSEAFKEEASEILTDMRKLLSQLETSQPSDTTFSEQLPHIDLALARLHSLKGSARAVSQRQTVTICQWLETAFAAAKADEKYIDRVLTHALSFSIELLDELLGLCESEGLSKNRIKAEIGKLLGVTDENDQTDNISGDREFTESPQQFISTAILTTNSNSDFISNSGLNSTSSPSLSKVDNLTSVRVPIEKLDRLLSETEELLTIKTKAAEYIQDLTQLKTLVSELGLEMKSLLEQPQTAKISEQLKVLQSKVSSMAKLASRDQNNSSLLINRYLETAKTLVMLPVSTCFEGFPRLVRELARELDKDVELTINGGQLEVDRRVLERLKDPLVHILRNAMDHGFESNEEREAQSKSKARLIVSARQLNGETIEITIEDNGRGIDDQAVKATAIKKLLVGVDEADSLTLEEVYALIFRSDFSTRETVSELSGRGLGLAIVKEKIEELNGRIELTSKPHVGSTFRIIVPTTLATFMGILVEASGQRFVVPLSGMNRAIRVHPLALEIVDERETFMVDGQVLPVAALTKALNLPDNASLKGTPSHNRGTSFKYLEMIVISHRDKKAGVIVDQILTEKEFLVKKLGFPLGQINNFAGATILSDSKVALVLNIADLVETIVKTRFMQDQKPMFGLAAMLDRVDSENIEVKAATKSILVVEDSLTSRIFLRNILEAAGYEVTLCVNGKDAFDTLHKAKSFDLVISDIEMPILDGLGLVKEIRSSILFKHLPIVLVTSLASETNKREGIEAGANAYFVKGDLNQANLLSVIRELV